MDLLLPPLGHPVVKDFVGDDVELEACLRLRYAYFVNQRAWVCADQTKPGVECDHYDAHALHLSVWDDEGVAAYLRALPYDPVVGFMLDRELACSLGDGEHPQLLRHGAVELSRLVVRPNVVAKRMREQPHPVERLLKRLYHLSKEREFARFYVVVEHGWLLPFARCFGLPFRAIGLPHVFPDGTKTVAAVATLDELEAGMRRHSASKHEWYQEEE